MEVLVTQGYTISLSRANWTRAGHRNQTELFFQELRTGVLGAAGLSRGKSLQRRGSWGHVPCGGLRKGRKEKRGRRRGSSQGVAARFLSCTQ